MKHTPLYERHIQTAAKVINLKGFARPVEYLGHIQEHQAIRNRVSICDVSHMGEIEFEGKEALALGGGLLVCPLLLMARGEKASFPVGTEVKAYVENDTVVKITTSS